MWLFIAILAYFLFALVSLGDKYLLSGPPNPKVYTFYVGVLGIASAILIPFVNFFIPAPHSLLFCFFAALNYIIFLYLIYSAIEKYEVSRVMPSSGALVPLITFVILLPFSGTLSLKEAIAFSLIVIGSLIIGSNFSKSSSLGHLKISLLIAVFLSLNFIFSKFAFIYVPFWTAFIWIRIFAFMIAILFIFSPAVKKELSGKKKSFNKKNSFLFVAIQILGASAFVLQSWSIALAGFIYLPIINALQGIQYIFLFALALLVSLKSKAIKEDLSRNAIFQKVFSLLAMAAGFVLLAF